MEASMLAFPVCSQPYLVNKSCFFPDRFSPCCSQNVLRSATVHTEGSFDPAATDLDLLAASELSGWDGVVDADSKDGSSTSPTRSTDICQWCFAKTSKKTHTVTFFYLQLYSIVKRKQEVPPQQRLLRAADLFCIRAIGTTFSCLSGHGSLQVWTWLIPLFPLNTVLLLMKWNIFLVFRNVHGMLIQDQLPKWSPSVNCQRQPGNHSSTAKIRVLPEWQYSSQLSWRF